MPPHTRRAMRSPRRFRADGVLTGPRNPMACPMPSSGIQTAEEPFQELLTQGMVHGVTYVSAATGQWLTPAQVTAAENGEVVETATVRCQPCLWRRPFFGEVIEGPFLTISAVDALVMARGGEIL